MNIRAYKSRFSRETEEGWFNTKGACHQSVGYKETKKFAVEFDDEKSDIELVKEWLQLLKSIGIYAEYKSNLEVGKIIYKNSILFDCDKSEKFKKGQPMLFAYKLIRLALKNSTFVKRVLENAVKFDKMKAWDLIYLTWQEKPVNEDYWNSYYDAFIRAKQFEYISLTNLLKSIENANSVENIFLTLSTETIIDISKIKNKSLNTQLKKCKLTTIPLVCNFALDINREPLFLYEGREYYIRNRNSFNCLICKDSSKYVKIKMYLKSDTGTNMVKKLLKKDLIDFYNKEKEKWEQN